jgi:phage tail tape-measure protein
MAEPTTSATRVRAWVRLADEPKRDLAQQVSTALAPITGVVGTIVGAYFGVQVGSSGQEQVESARAKAEDQAKALAAVAPSEAAVAVLGVPVPTTSVPGIQ